MRDWPQRLPNGLRIKMASVLRGEVYWAELDPTLGQEQGGRRPVLVLSEDIFNVRSGTVIAVALTSQEPKAAYPLTLEIINAGNYRIGLSETLLGQNQSNPHPVGTAARK